MIGESVRLQYLFLYNAVCVVNTLRWKKTNWNYTLFSEIRELIVRCYRVGVWLRLISFRTFNPTNIYTFKIMRVFCFWLCKFDFSNVKNIFSIHFMFQTTLHTRSKCLRFQTTVWFGYPIYYASNDFSDILEKDVLKSKVLAISNLRLSIVYI